MDNIELREAPRQKIAYSEKNQQWREDNVDSVISLCNALGRSRRSSNKQKRRNYNLFNNKIDKADFDYVLNPFNLSKETIKEFQFPASLQPYDIISQYFQLLLGEEMKRTFNPVVIAINQDAISDKQNRKKAEMFKALESILIDTMNGDPNQIPEELKKYKNYSPKDAREKLAESLLQHYNKKDKLPEFFNACFKDVLIGGEEIARVDQIADEPKPTRVNSLEVYFLLPNNSDKIDDAEKIYERNRLSVSEIIDEFYEFLTPTQIDDLESYAQGNTTNYTYAPFLFNISEVDSIYTFEDDYGERGIPVHRCRWKSKKKVGSLHYLNDNNEEEEVLVDETYKIDKNDKTQWIEWFWINEYWEGTRIGQDLYLNIRPRKQQFRSIDNLSTCKSGYIGTVYSATNSQSVSLMDRLVPWIYLYLIIWYRTELAMAKNIGKLGLIDISLIPDEWEPEKWMYYAQAMGFGFVNSYNESNKIHGGNMSQSTQNKSLDLEQGAYIKNHIDLLAFIEERIQNTSGITRQRLGSIETSELVGNTERSVTQSSHITEPYFAPHESFKIRVCEAIIEVAKDCLENKKKNFQYITDDLSSILFEVDGDDFSNADYGVFISNSKKDEEGLDTLKQLLQAAIQNDKVELSSVVDVLNSRSLTTIKHTLVDAEQERNEMLQKQTEAQQQHEMQIHQETMDLEQQKLDLEKYKIDTEANTKIQTEEMKALAIDEGATPNAIIDTGEHALKQQELSSKQYIEQQKILHDKDIKGKELQLKEKELKAKQEIEQKKLDAVKEQNKNQIQLANKKASLDEKMANKKIELEKIKTRAAIAKSRQKPTPKKK